LTSTDTGSQLFLANELKGAIEGWVNTGWPGLTETTYQLFKYWFNRDDNSQGRFHICQQRAIETLVYCHEVLQAKSLQDLFMKVYPNVLNSSQAILEEAQSVDFAKYCLKMATGTGKTWVLIALLIWQYFNAQNQEKPREADGRSKDWYSDRFLLVAPGREVLDRLLDAFKGRREPSTGLRNPSTADYRLPLMMPPDWRSKFNIQIFEPSEIRSNTTPPEGPFIFITNWQQFVMKKDAKSLWEELTGAEIGEQPRGDFLAEFLSKFPSLVVMNDEAHHVHSGRTATNEELVWRKFIKVLHTKLEERHSEDKGLFIQYDFSATPFFGSGTQKKYFGHIVYDYDLVAAMHAMLVKQLFLEKRMQLAVENLDFRAFRKKPESGKKLGEIIGLSQGQMLMLEIGRQKIENLTNEFQSKGITKKPVMMVLCEETAVARMVKEHFRRFMDSVGSPYDDRKVMEIHTDMKDAELEEARRKLDKIDDNSDPLNVVISVLMLREGFDRRNISVIVVLRATAADLLLEQIVGRGLRLMFPKTEDNSSVWQLKEEAIADIRNNKMPKSSFDCLFIVEQPRFEKFYQKLREEGYLIAIGDTSKVQATGDIIAVDAIPIRIPEFDIAWPVQIFEQGAFPDLATIDVSKIPRYSILTSFTDLRNSMGHITVQDVHYESGKRTKSWKFDTTVFSYSMFLSKASQAIAEEGKTTVLSGHLSEIAQLIDEYTSSILFGEKIDFEDPKNCLVLNNVLIFDFIVDQVRRAILLKLGELKYEQTGLWRKLSDVGRLMLREKNSVETWRTIYPRQGFSAKGGGFERDFMSNVLEQSLEEVNAYAKLDRRHALLIPYRDEYGILREYEVDFIVKTNDKVYLVETKADKDLNDPTVMLKAKAAHAWCANASKVSSPNTLSQPQEFEYLVLPEGLFKANSGLGFNMFVPPCREVRNRMIETFDITISRQKSGL
jgi:type III restriction enzyme